MSSLRVNEILIVEHNNQMARLTFSQWIELVVAIVAIILYFAVADAVIAVAFLFILIVSLTALIVGKISVKLRRFDVYGRQGIPL
jgi:hypothetical protein